MKANSLKSLSVIKTLTKKIYLSILKCSTLTRNYMFQVKISAKISNNDALDGPK